MTGMLWPFGADWDREVRISYEFSTEVIQSEAGKEQRIANRTDPRISIEFDTLVAEFEFQDMQAMINSEQNKAMRMPDWSRPALLRLDSEAADTRFPIESVEPWMRPGVQVAAIWDGGVRTAYVEKTVASSTANWLNLTTTLAVDVPQTAAVCRTWTGRLSSRISARLHSDRIVSLNVRFDVDPGSENLGTPPAATITHQGRELMVMEPDWSSDISMELETVLRTLDYGKGRVYHTAPVPFNTRSLSLTYMLMGRGEIDAMQNFLLRLRGQQGEFFMPTFTEDMRLSQQASQGSFAIRVFGQGAWETYTSSEVYSNLVVIYNDLQVEPFTIESAAVVSDSGQHTLFTLDRALPRLTNASQVAMICWLPLWRLLSDNFTMVWDTDQTAKVALSMKTLETLSAEVV